MLNRGIMNVSFAVLHYERIDVTKRCVDSLLNLYAPPVCHVNIIVVDNMSPNNSYNDLLVMYGDNPVVTLIQSEQNDGFAQGNNIAYKYMQDHLDTEIGIFLNNDTEIQDNDFIKKLVALYQEKPFDVLAVDVYDPHADQHQSPLCLGSDLLSYAKNEKKRAVKFLHMTKLEKVTQTTKVAISQLLYPCPFFKKAVEKRIKSYSQSVDWEASLTDVVVQGSCVIYGKTFFNIMNYAFYPATTMYFEECILKILCDEKGLTTTYSPELSVLHHHQEYSRKYIRSNSVASLQKRARLELESYMIFDELSKSLIDA